MKIGVYLGHGPVNPEAGGGFTFQDAILHELFAYHGEHTFYLYYYGHELVSNNPNVVYRSIDRYVTTTNNLLVKIGYKIARKFDCYSAKKQYQSLLNRAVMQDGVELMWFMTPAYEFVDIPYLFTVWDLQHRLQSFFPEVSCGSTFDKREQFYQRVVERAAYVITGNQTARQEVIRFYGMPDERVKAVEFPTPPFVLNEKNKLSEDRPLRLPVQQPYLFYPAQFWPHKNHVILLEAIKILKERYHCSFSLIFTGSDKGNLTYIKDLASDYKVSEQVHFLGFVSTQELIYLYKNAFALTFASYFGPNNIPPLEAMALNCPVIAADAAGMREQLGDAALFFNPRNAEELVDHILQLKRNDHLRLELAARGKQRALSWTPKDYMKAIIEVIDEFAPVRKCWSSDTPYVHS